VRLGFPEKVLGRGGLSERDGRRWQNAPHLRVSIEKVHAIVDYLRDEELRMYRISQGLAPYASHPDLPQFWGQVDECVEELAALGARFREADVRVTMHTNPYVVLSSAREEVLATAVRELSWQAALFDAMGMGPESVIVVHVGSQGPEAGARWLDGVASLPEHARARVVLENDDRGAGLGEVLALAREAGVRVVFDQLHHRINDPEGIPEAEALALACATWPEGVTPKIHFSSPKTHAEETGKGQWRFPRIVAHADLVDVLDFEAFLRGPVAALGRDLDVLVEARLKDLAVLRLREQLAARGVEL
jgi:UV DNA damage endonuclease